MTDVSTVSKFGRVFFVMLKMVIRLKISIYCAIFFLTHNIYQPIVSYNLKPQEMRLATIL
jgi:hypothetical protein